MHVSVIISQQRKYELGLTRVGLMQPNMSDVLRADCKLS